MDRKIMKAETRISHMSAGMARPSSHAPGGERHNDGAHSALLYCI